MRGEVTGLAWWLALALLVGIVTGRIVIPLLEPHVVHHIDIANKRGARECTYSFGKTTTSLGRKSYLEGVDDLKCNEQRAFAGTWLQCKCAN